MKKNIKKIIALFVAVLTVTAFMTVSAKEETVGMGKAETCVELLAALKISNELGDDLEREITVEEYASLLIRLLNYNLDDDVMTQARSMGIILNDIMEAKDSLTWKYALQMSASALGYNAEVSVSNGDINTFVAIAEDIELTKNVTRPADGICSVRCALEIVNNMLDAPMIIRTNKGGFYRDESATLIKTCYKLKMYEGIITAIENTSLFSENGGVGDRHIMVGDRTFSYDNQIDIDMLGSEVTLYADEDDVIIYLDFHERKVMKLMGDDILSISDTVIKYAQENTAREERLRLKDTYNIIKNGQATKASLADTVKLYSELAFTDGDCDGFYDTVFVETPMYMVVSVHSYSDEALYGNNKEVIDLNGEVLNIYSEKHQKEVGKESIKAGDFIKAIISDNGKYTDLTIKEGSLVGSVSGITDTDKGTLLKIGKEEYYTNEYFDEYAKSGLKFNIEYKFFLDNGKIAYIDSGNNILKYGFYITQYCDDGEIIPTLKVLTSDGDIKNLEMAEKVKFDGEGIKGAAAAARLTSPQLIAYKTNDDARITIIDTAEPSLNPYDPVSSNPDNALLKYDSKAALYYKSGIKNLGGVCTATPDIFFVVPKNLSTADLTQYGIGSIAVFENDTSYTLGTDIDIYNITEDRAPGIIVCYGSKLETYTDTTLNAVVESIETYSNEDYDFLYKINYIQSGTYSSVYADPYDKDFSLNKKSGEMIGPGDVVRFSQKDGYVTDFVCDFDAEKMEMDNKTASYNSVSTNRSLQFKSGYVYSVKDGRIILDLTGKTNPADVTWADTATYNIPSSGIILIERKRDTSGNITKNYIRIIDSNEIMTYVNSGDKASYAFMRQNYFATQCLVIYRDI